MEDLREKLVEEYKEEIYRQYWKLKSKGHYSVEIPDFIDWLKEPLLDWHPEEEK